MSIKTSSAKNNFYVTPREDEIEISIFGSGFGECVVVHTGFNEWIIIDSCQVREIDSAVAAFYLSSLGVDQSTAVKAIIATHWDDDHITGISDLVENCKNAEFFSSAALNDHKFRKLILASPLARLAALNKRVPTGISEFNKIVQILKARNKKVCWTIRDQRLWKSAQKHNVELISLSPHGDIFQKAIESIISQIPEEDNIPVTKIAAPATNYTSIVLFLRVEGRQMLLGADLEEKDEHKGWSLILEESTYKDEITGEVFKIPHHGSSNGHHPEVWSNLLMTNPHCLIAPFNKNPKLPGQGDLERIAQYSSEIYVSSPPVANGPAKSREKSARRAYESTKAKHLLSELNLVRLRSKIGSTNWEVELFGKAFKYQIVQAA